MSAATGQLLVLIYLFFLLAPLGTYINRKKTTYYRSIIDGNRDDGGDHDDVRIFVFVYNE